MAPNWDIGDPYFVVVPIGAENGFEQKFPMPWMSNLPVGLLAGLLVLLY